VAIATLITVLLRLWVKHFLMRTQLAIGVSLDKRGRSRAAHCYLNADSRGRMKRGRQLRRPYFCEGGLVQ
jgi:hypothetical protein